MSFKYNGSTRLTLVTSNTGAPLILSCDRNGDSSWNEITVNPSHVEHLDVTCQHGHKLQTNFVDAYYES